MTTLPEPEQLTHLVDEVTSILAEKKFRAGLELLEMRHMIGRAVLDSPLYRKHGKGQGALVKAVAEQVGLEERSLRYCIEVAVKYPKFATLLQSADPNHKLPAWRDIVRELPSGRHAEKEVEPKCKHKCPIHQ